MYFIFKEINVKINGKWVFLNNHTINDLDKLYEWSQDIELIEIECDNIENIKKNKDINDFKNNCVIPRYIGMNHESNSPMCYFGIYRNYNNELIGTVVFQYLNKNEAELSLSICEKKYRNMHYGIDAAIIALKYAFKIINLENIIMQTRIDNIIVKNICKKIGLSYEVEHYKDDNYDVDLVRYTLNKDTYENILKKFFLK